MAGACGIAVLLCDITIISITIKMEYFQNLLAPFSRENNRFTFVPCVKVMAFFSKEQRTVMVI